MNEFIRSLFPALGTLTYLNSAAVSPIPTTAIDAVNAQLSDVSRFGANHYADWVATKERARTLLAGMLGTRPDQIAFMRNTSDGFAAVANGLDWKADDNIVSFANEFPANFYPWRMARERFGVELRLCPERDGRIDHAELISMIDRNTRLVSISAVQFASGFRADLERIGRAARDVDALFAVDIIQGLGAHGFDLPGQFVDIASGASHKWLCAPEGCGILFLSDRARDRIEPAFVGWISVEDPWNFQDREQSLKPNALALESGTGPSSLFYGLEASLKLLSDTGLDRIEHYLDGLTDQLCDGLQGAEYSIVSSRDPGERSAIVCIKHDSGESPRTIAERLMKRGIVVSPRNDVVRIAPHFYNNATDIATLLEAL